MATGAPAPERPRAARALLVASVSFIVYATTLPWDFGRPLSWARVEGWPLGAPAGGAAPSLPDFAQNILLFLPFGGFAALARDRPCARRAVTAVVVPTLAGFLLSIAVESLQTMSWERTPSTADVAANTLGAALGGALAALWGRHLEARVRARIVALAGARPGLVVVALWGAGLALPALAPFVPSVDPGIFRAHLRALVHAPWGTKPPGALVPSAVYFGGFAVLLAGELARSSARRGAPASAARWRRRAALGALAGALALSASLELAQLFLVAHGVGLGELAAAGIGAAAALALGGFVLGDRGSIPGDGLGRLARSAPCLVLAYALCAPTARALAPFHFAPLAQRLAAFEPRQLIPLWSLLRDLGASTVQNVFEAALAYAPLGWVLAARGAPPPRAAALAALLALGLELLQLGVAERTFDPGEGLHAAAGALAAAWAYRRLRACGVGGGPTPGGSAEGSPVGVAAGPHRGSR